MDVIKKQTVSWGKIPRKPMRKYNFETDQIEEIEGCYLYLDYATRSDRNVEWIDPFIFYATIQITDIVRGRSAANFSVVDMDGNEYTLHMAGIKDLLDKTDIKQGGFITGYWQFRKRGTSFGIEYVGLNV